MKFTTLLLTIGTLAATASATSPNPSNTNIHINTSPHTVITKSRVSSTLDKKAPLIVDAPDAAVDAISRAGRRIGIGRRAFEAPASESQSNAVRDASSDAVKTRSAMSGVSRRATATVLDATNPEVKHRAIEKPSHRRSADDNETYMRRRGMGKARRQRSRSSQHQKRESKVQA